MLRFVVLLLGFTVVLSSEAPPTVAELPPNCLAQLYRWDGENLVCSDVDRVAVLRAQRAVNFEAYRAAQAGLTHCRSENMLNELLFDARLKCRALGRAFDETNADCGDSLPQAIPELQGDKK